MFLQIQLLLIIINVLYEWSRICSQFYWCSFIFSLVISLKSTILYCFIYIATFNFFFYILGLSCSICIWICWLYYFIIILSTQYNLANFSVNRSCFALLNLCSDFNSNLFLLMNFFKIFWKTNFIKFVFF